MASDTITLTNDPDMIAQLNSERVLVAVPLLYAFMVTLSLIIDSLSVSGFEVDQEWTR